MHQQLFVEMMDCVHKCSRPLIVILGSTGSGKSKLAAEICRAISGEIVSADSMQLYEGLAVATNQTTPEERLGIPEHLVGFLPPLTFGYTVHSFRDDGLRVIEDIHRRNKIPVLVGGTNYYIEAILWDNLVGDTTNSKSYYFNLPASVLCLSNGELHKTLQSVDPEQAAILHPNNRRRILRSLQIWYTLKRKHSELLNAQRKQAGGSGVGGPLRFTKSLILWLQCDLPMLFSKLRHRIDAMVNNGLRQEITSFYDTNYCEYRSRQEEVKHLGANGQPMGAFQCIGVKEFLEFLGLPRHVRDSSDGDAVFEKCLSSLHLATCQYAKRQVKWIRNRFVRRTGGDIPPIYAFALPSVGTWEAEVMLPCVQLVKAFLSGESIKMPTVNQARLLQTDACDKSVYRRCDTCDRLISTDQWQAHVFSKRHRRCKARSAKVDHSSISAC